MPAQPTYGDFRRNPLWDPLRNDPPFVKIVASLAPKNRKAQPRCSTKRSHARHKMKYWEIIADNLSKAGWSWGCASAIDSNGRTIWIADAHRDDGRRFVAVASANRSTACCSDGRAAPFTSFGSVDRTRSCARTTQHAGQASGARIVTKRRRRRPPDAQLSAPA